MAWRIAVESESAAREEVGGGTEDLGEAVAAALSLADDLGRLMGDHQVRSTIHVYQKPASRQFRLRCCRVASFRTKPGEDQGPSRQRLIRSPLALSVCNIDCTVAKPGLKVLYKRCDH